MSNSENITQSIQDANAILSQYGKTLSLFDQSSYGIPLSKLPCDKIDIKNAIQLLLLELETDDLKIQEGLIQGYVILAQFLPDDKIAILLEANSIFDNESVDKSSYDVAEQASQIISDIKLNMEELMDEIKLYITKGKKN